MYYKIKKIIFISLAILLFISVSTGIMVYVTYSKNTNKTLELNLKPFTIKPDENILLGKVITATLKFDCLWGHSPNSVDIITANGVQIVQQPKIKKIKTLWGKNTWEISIKIQPYGVGEIEEEKCQITFISEENKKQSIFTTIIPDFEVFSVETGKNRKLDIATKVETSFLSSFNTWGYLLIVLLIAIISFVCILILILFILLKKKKEVAKRELPPWVVALGLLHELREKVSENQINKEICITRLTDVVRKYIEKRFNINITAQTTYEFLFSLDKGNSPFKTEFKLFLRDFLSAADLIKFAKLPADDALIENAMVKAEELINSTIPTNDENKIKDNK